MTDTKAFPTAFIENAEILNLYDDVCEYTGSCCTYAIFIWKKE